MSMNIRNVLQHELIGLEVEVTESTNLYLEGKKGIIMDETRNTLTIKEEGELKMLPKKEIVFSVKTPEGEKVKVKGRKIVARPEDRTKKLG